MNDAISRIRKETRRLKDSIFKHSLSRCFGEFFWNSCPVCGCRSVRTTFRETGQSGGEHLTCAPMSELAELEEPYDRKAA